MIWDRYQRKRPFDLANLQVQISWQAQHFVNFQSADFVAGTALVEPRTSKHRLGGSHSTLRSWMRRFRGKHSPALSEPGQPGSADFRAGAALCEPGSADFVAGTALCEPGSAWFGKTWTTPTGRTL